MEASNAQVQAPCACALPRQVPPQPFHGTDHKAQNIVVFHLKTLRQPILFSLPPPYFLDPLIELNRITKRK